MKGLGLTPMRVSNTFGVNVKLPLHCTLCPTSSVWSAEKLPLAGSACRAGCVVSQMMSSSDGEKSGASVAFHLTLPVFSKTSWNAAVSPATQTAQDDGE